MEDGTIQMTYHHYDGKDFLRPFGGTNMGQIKFKHPATRSIQSDDLVEPLTDAILRAHKKIEQDKVFHDPSAPLGRAVMGMADLFMCQGTSRQPYYFKNLREAYVYLTGDTDIRGQLNPRNIHKDLRSCQDFDSGTFAYAFLNAMNMSLSKMYGDFPYHEELLISEKKSVNDFRPNSSFQLGYFGELPDVDPESGDYASFGSYADSQTKYSLSQKGGIINVSRMHIINDAIGLVIGMVKRMARAARLAHAKYVWNIYINNALCPDGTAWFTAAHGNLGSNAIDISPLVTAITALANMTEPGSEEKLGMDLASFNWFLVVPIALWDTAVKKNQADSYFTSNDLTAKVPNPCQRLFGEKNERIITCPFITDATDWGIIRHREDVPIVEMSYMNGREAPEFIPERGPATRGNTEQESIFKADKLGFKIRHEYGGTLADYRGGYKSIVG